MEAPLELLIYVFLFSAFFTTMKYYFIYQKGNKWFIHHIRLDDMESEKICRYCLTIYPFRNFFVLQQRKIPHSDPSRTDDEGSRLLVFP
ncbi:hypothetical protein B0I26_10899 [Anoxybacillus vitaminiphilus]|uniref:Uncharacterized protein n=1 Tax=Paranoxybacillus vitaminiphilus TaxID=581036 RepID=A0A327YDL5_9BACL|nr:hypothetical protein [Anoxybacillus vitaminiphilus]RAK18924.1 hypothetical protein B0I26_10899 [Anoxybacillus vitaminiphilus]